MAAQIIPNPTPRKDSARTEQMLQQAELDTMRSEDIRNLGGALYCGRRYARVFMGYNGAQSNYSGLAFRGRGGFELGRRNSATLPFLFGRAELPLSGHVGCHQAGGPRLAGLASKTALNTSSVSAKNRRFEQSFEQAQK